MVKAWTFRLPLLVVMLPGLATAPANAQNSQPSQTWQEWLSHDPIEWQFDNYEIRLGAFVGGALFTAAQDGGPGYPGGYENSGTTAGVTTNIRLQRTFDNGLVAGVRTDFLLYRDRLSSDNFDNDTVERLFVFIQTGFGRVEIGQQDGAAYTLGLTGPLVDQQVTLESRNFALFRDPTTGEDFGAFFNQVTTVRNSSNYAKINYVSPRLFGVQIGVAFTPQTVRTPLPFTGNPSDDPNQQHALWEFATSYTGYFSGISLGVTGGFAHGRLKNRTDGRDDFYDWAVGTQVAYSLSDTKLSVGGAYRGTNAYLLEIEQVLDGSRSRMVQLSTTLEKATWLIGAEFSRADVQGPVDYGITGFQLSAGYKVNANMQLTVGWQHHHYNRDSGVFYNGLSAIGMNAGFLSVGYTL